jgi:two-component system, NtrC family, response regulator AtoC
MATGKILIADDELLLLNSLNKIVSSAGYTVVTTPQGKNVIPLIQEHRPDLLLLDIFLGDSDGLEILQTITTMGLPVGVLIMTANADVPRAVEAMRLGALDFLPKPFEMEHLLIQIEKALDHTRLARRVKVLETELDDQRSRHGIIGTSMKLSNVLKTAERLAQSDDTTVLIEGESGVGKEMVARFVHQRSPRAQRSFITVNCGAIPKDLAESEFFGYEKGAFTGATEKMKQGKFELAEGGTILLDEVGELSLDMQVKLLRVLEEKRIYRLGGVKEITLDARVIAATNRDLSAEVEGGRFREDLFYRLNVATVRIPALRERREDIALLTHAFLGDLSKRFNRSVPELTPDASHFLESLPWKGNVRELRNAIERVLLLTDAPRLTPEHFSFLAPGRSRGNGNGAAAAEGHFSLTIPPNGISMKEVLRDLILKTLAITNGNQVQAARILGITRSKLRYRMEMLGIQPENRSYSIQA